MRVPENHADMEDALRRLMPVALRETMRVETEDLLDDLAGEARVSGFAFKKGIVWLGAGGIAAAFGIASLFVFKGGVDASVAGKNPAAALELPPELVFLTGTDRVEDVKDDGMFVDSGGSAVRKVRIRVVEESRIRDEETGIVVQVTEPREEMYLVPVSTF